MSHHLFNPQPIPRMRLIQEGPFPSIGPMPAYIGAAGNGATNSVRDEFVEASGVAGAASRSQAVLMPAKPVPSVAKGPKGKRAAGVSPARANVTKKRKSSIMAAAATVAPPPPPPPPPLPPGGVGVNPRPVNCKYRNSYPLTQQHQPQQPPTQTRRRRTVEDFLSFCKMILDYENYTEQDEDGDRQRHSSSPLGSTGSSSGSGWEGPPPPPEPAPASSNELPSSSTNGFKNKKSPAPSSSPEYQGGAATTEETEEEDIAAEEENDEDSWNSVTCFCKKPFAGRPMIECSSCYTWVHIKCAKLSRRKIPDVWFCQKCRVASPPPTPASTSKAKGHNKADPSSSNGANKTKSSPVKQPAGARKRKSSLTSKRVVVIKDTSAPAAAATASADDDDYELVLAPPAAAASSSSPERPRTPVLAAADNDTTSASSSSPVTSSSPDGGASRKWRPSQEVDEVSPGEGGDS